MGGSDDGYWDEDDEESDPRPQSADERTAVGCAERGHPQLIIYTRIIGDTAHTETTCPCGEVSSDIS